MWPLPLWSETEFMDRRASIETKKGPLVEVQWQFVLSFQPCILPYSVCAWILSLVVRTLYFGAFVRIY